MSRTAKVSRACIEEIKRLRAAGHGPAFTFYQERHDGIVLSYLDGEDSVDVFADGHTVRHVQCMAEEPYDERDDGCSEYSIERRNDEWASEQAARCPEGE